MASGKAVLQLPILTAILNLLKCKKIMFFLVPLPRIAGGLARK